MRKKSLILIIILFLLIDVNASIQGDVNNDGIVNAQDYLLVKKHILGISKLTGDNLVRADVNQKDGVTSLDYIVIKKIILNGQTVQDVESISLSNTNLSLDGGDVKKITVTISPSGAQNKNITWTSSNPKVAAVDQFGNVTANTRGTSIITATTSNGKKATCTVNVTLNITYKEIRHIQENGLATNIWYAIIPKKYKMHYAYGNNVVGNVSPPSTMAKNLNATLAINTQLLGFPIIDGKQVGLGTNVSGYDFYVEKTPGFQALNINYAPWEALKIYATKDYTKGITFKDINVGFEYEGDHVKYNNKETWLALFAQIIMNRKTASSYGPLDNTTAYFAKYYTSQEKKQNARHPRTWIAYDSNGTQYVAVATGRDIPLPNGKNLSQAGLTYWEIIDVTKKYMTTDIVTLYNLDGGGSSCFIYNGTKLNGNYDKDANGNRYERSNLGVFYW